MMSLRSKMIWQDQFVSDEDVYILSALRSRCVECRENFKNRYSEDDRQCQLCKRSPDSQRHMLECEVINQHIKSKMIEDDKANYDDIFAEVRKQKRVTVLFKNILEIRKKLESDPSTSGEVLKNSFDLHDCIDIFSSGK